MLAPAQLNWCFCCSEGGIKSLRKQLNGEASENMNQVTSNNVSQMPTTSAGELPRSISGSRAFDETARFFLLNAVPQADHRVVDGRNNIQLPALATVAETVAEGLAKDTAFATPDEAVSLVENATEVVESHDAENEESSFDTSDSTDGAQDGGGNENALCSSVQTLALPAAYPCSFINTQLEQVLAVGVGNDQMISTGYANTMTYGNSALLNVLPTIVPAYYSDPTQAMVPLAGANVTYPAVSYRPVTAPELPIDCHITSYPVTPYFEQKPYTMKQTTFYSCQQHCCAFHPYRRNNKGRPYGWIFAPIYPQY
ncbi:uncharacterized protein LOC118461139 isoform X2 [Anopheles albimanus]|nr:uncharacterized protein LOC118461139 isoform X2 [Anopheles albimanus]